MAVTESALTLPMLPLPNGVVFPDTVVTLTLERSESRAAADAALDGQFVLVPNLAGRPARVATLATIEDRGRLRNGTPALTVRGVGRARLGAGVMGTGDALWIAVDPIDEAAIDRHASADADIRELADRYRALATRLLDELGGGRYAGTLPDVDRPGSLADTIAYWPELAAAQRVELLETLDIAARLKLAIEWATSALAEVDVAKRINQGVAKDLEQDQRQAVLRRQLAAIRAELGNGGDDDIIAMYRQRLDGLASAGVADTVIDAVRTEIDRLERVGEQGQESSWIRTWLDEVLELPFGVRSDEPFDLRSARAVLDSDHTGLHDVKERIVEHLAVRKLASERGVAEVDGRRSSAMIALVGPPGVGKTSLGASIAKALERRFVRMALGGIRDEAEIRGHRRTYVGARPGRLVRALREAGTMNPVILLDEIDKLGADWRGDPAAALLEVLDPAQNHRFRDHYLEFELDLSDVVFVATANRLDSIPEPLLDRVEVVELDGYTDEEKAAIARDHLLPRLRARIGLTDEEVVVTDEAIGAVVADWTREAGVRNLERRLDTLLRKAATRLADDSFDHRAAGPIVVTPEDLRTALGRPTPRNEVADRVTEPGIATGLAVTGAGGDVLFVEATAMDGEPGLTLTGQLGDVMKESGEIARSWLRSHAAELALDGTERRLHVHFPSGAVPKDGPSAGITMTTAMASLLSGRRVRPEIAMTGEVSLHGRVLPIGGVTKKLLAAHRAGLDEVILPAGNADDLDDVPERVLADLTVHLVNDVREVLDLALEADPVPRS